MYVQYLLLVFSSHNKLMYSGTHSIVVWLVRLVAYQPYSRKATCTRVKTYRISSASGAELNQL